MLTATIWDHVLSRIEGHVGKHSFSTWFKPTSLLTDAGNSISIRVPNLLFVEWLPKHYSVVLSEALREVGRADVKLVFVPDAAGTAAERSEEHTSELQSQSNLVCRRLLEKKSQRTLCELTVYWPLIALSSGLSQTR